MRQLISHAGFGGELELLPPLPRRDKHQTDRQVEHRREWK